MRKIATTIAVAVTIVLAGSIAASAAGKQDIITTGCYENHLFCQLLKTKMGTYALFGMTQFPAPGQNVLVIGTVDDGINLCGTPHGIRVVVWKNTGKVCK
jgi:hypothetical protein